jgi:hypothetical protein
MLFVAMLVRSCRVTIRDWECVTHTVEVTAAAWYAALAQGLAAIRGNDWVAEVAQGLNVVKVSVADVRIVHEVKLMEFTKWLERDGASPRETQRPEQDSRSPGNVDATVEAAGR